MNKERLHYELGRFDQKQTNERIEEVLRQAHEIAHVVTSVEQLTDLQYVAYLKSRCWDIKSKVEDLLPSLKQT